MEMILSKWIISIIPLIQLTNYKLKPNIIFSFTKNDKNHKAHFSPKSQKRRIFLPKPQKDKIVIFLPKSKISFSAKTKKKYVFLAKTKNLILYQTRKFCFSTKTRKSRFSAKTKHLIFPPKLNFFAFL